MCCSFKTSYAITRDDRQYISRRDTRTKGVGRYIFRARTHMCRLPFKLKTDPLSLGYINTRAQIWKQKDVRRIAWNRHGTKVNAAAVFRRQRLLSPAARLGPRGGPRSFERLRPVPYEPRVAYWGDTRINRFLHHPWGTIIDAFFFCQWYPL